MAARECYHCKQLVEEGEAHDCWTTTEQALTGELSEELAEAWQRLRAEASALGEQRIYASHRSIMFARTNCYFFVRPKSKALEVCFFLGAALKSPAVRKTQEVSRTKVAHFVNVTHRDQVEPPLTEWLAAAYEYAAAPRAVAATPAKRAASGAARAKGAKKRAAPAKRAKGATPAKGAKRGAKRAKRGAKSAKKAGRAR